MNVESLFPNRFSCYIESGRVSHSAPNLLALASFIPKRLASVVVVVSNLQKQVAQSCDDEPRRQGTYQKVGRRGAAAQSILRSPTNIRPGTA